MPNILVAISLMISASQQREIWPAGMQIGHPTAGWNAYPSQKEKEIPLAVKLITFSLEHNLGQHTMMPIFAKCTEPESKKENKNR